MSYIGVGRLIIQRKGTKERNRERERAKVGCGWMKDEVAPCSVTVPLNRFICVISHRTDLELPHNHS